MDTANLLTDMEPDYVGVLMLVPQTPLYDDYVAGQFF